MAEVAYHNVTDDSTLAQSVYDDEAILGFAESSRTALAVSDDMKTLTTNTQNFVFTKVAPEYIFPTASTDEGDGITAVDPTSTQVTVSWAPKYTKSSIDQASQQAACIDMIGSSLKRWGIEAGKMYDYHAMTALLAGTTNADFMGSGTVGATLATDVLTYAQVRKMVSTLRASEAPEFFFGGQSGYLMYVHPYVAHELMIESSGIATGPTNVNSVDVQGFRLNYAAGCFFVERVNGRGTSTPMRGTGLGAASINVYNSVMVADQSFAMVHAPVGANPLGKDFKCNPEGSIIVREIYQTEELGTMINTGIAANIGWGIVQQTGVYSVGSGCSLNASAD